MLGVLSMPEFEVGELHIHTDEEIECSNILEKLLENGLLADTYDAAKRSLYDITTFGEILIDFTWQGVSDTGQTLFAQNPGGAPANVAGSLVESTSRFSRIRQPPANFYCSTGKRKSPLPFFHFLIITASDSAIP